MNFGDKVVVTGVLKRRAECRGHGYTAITWKLWEPKPITPCDGNLIGFRTLVDGTRDWIGDDEGYRFEPYTYHRVALVVFNERENPVYVKMEDLHEPI